MTNADTSELQGLLDRFRFGADLAAAVASGVAGDELDWKPGEAKWSVRQIACHLSDSEAVGTMRFRLVIAEENPVIQWYDEQAWSEKTDYDRRPLSTALETFRRLRMENYELLKHVPREAWTRKGVHTRTGEKTLLDLLRIYADHAEGHARQIRAVRAAYLESQSKQPS